MPLPVSSWRCFQSLPSDAEALSFSENCLFSLATLEVDCDSATQSFALTEQERPDAWRWAIVSDRGTVLCAGCEPSQLKAKQVASEILHRHPVPAAENPPGPDRWTD